MRIRLFEQTLRYRLSPEEVQQLRQTGTVAATTWCGPVQCQYAIMAHDGVKDVELIADKNCFYVTLPVGRMQRWADEPATDRLRAVIPGGAHHPDLLLLIEKDLGCAHGAGPSGEADATEVPPPAAAGDRAPTD